MKSDLDQYRAFKNSRPDPKERRSDLKRYIAACDRIVAVVRDCSFLCGSAREDVLPTLGAMLSATGFKRFGTSIGAPNRIGVEELLRSIVSKNRGINPAELVHGLEELSIPVRQAVAVQIGPELIVELIESMKGPALRLLQIDKLNPNRGGRPRDVEREHVVLQARDVYRQETKKRETLTRDGAFVRFCADVMEPLELDTDTATTERFYQQAQSLEAHRRFAAEMVQEISPASSSRTF
ncbi:hypothetical protein ABEG18_24905 [Alsobacter sp. KACC 23698]|uniref:Uncharacterized protein n=1 Tax=Alsobacter sp. KACC 23698 TaxID=3149229 RepID=A0AAU7JFF5_9HYPH